MMNRFTNEQQAIDYIENAGWSETKLGLERTRELLRLLGDPQRRLKFVHVAGSNGKGSTCAMLDSILRRAGYRVGLYTSPFLVRFNENIRVDGKEIDGARLMRLTERVRDAAESMDDHPSRFEMTTALGMLFFLESGCDIVVLEVGLGGEMDSTNVIDPPEVAVITNITLEHTEYLGNTLGEIAATKGGIIKAGCSAVCYDGSPEVTSVIAGICEGLMVPLRSADFTQLEALAGTLCGQRFRYRGKEYEIALPGAYQIYNATVALEVVDALKQRGWRLPDEAVRRGLSAAGWKARFEQLAAEPLVILDGGHNPQCAEALAKSLDNFFPGRRVTFLMGVLADKDYDAILDILAPHALEFLCVTPPSPRALAAGELAEAARSHGCKAVSFGEDVNGAVAAALTPAADSCEADAAGILVIFGSLYFAGAVLADFMQLYKSWLRRRKIAAREALTESARKELSAQICQNIMKLDAYRKASVIMLYEHIRSEVRLEDLAAKAAADGKTLCYPVCLAPHEMIAVEPGNEDDICESGEGAWRSGLYGIPEPALEKGRIVPPDEIDLVICPCASFDEQGHRLGMGGGFYDAYLPLCTKAESICAAFEVQRAASIPSEEHDVSMKIIVTEKCCH